MENPAFLESDQSLHQSGSTLNMSQRRPRHLPSLHHSAHSHPRALSNAITSHSTPTTTTTPLAPVHLSHSHIPHVPPNHALYPDPALPPLYPAHMAAHALQQQQQQAGTPTGEPLYSCQAPRGHDHVYQCPGGRATGVGAEPLDHHHHHYPHNHQQQLQYQDQLEDEQLEEEHQQQLEQHHQSLDHRPEYHYGGSDYSSTEPIYAQPHLYPREGGSTSSGTHTPTLGFSNPRTSLRSGRVPSPGAAATPTSNKYIVRSSGDSSASSSTLPTVSALLDPAHHPLHHTHLGPAHLTANSLRDTTRNSRASGRSSKGVGGGGGGGSSSPVPAKLKRQGLFRAWKLKFLRGEGGKRRFYLLAAALVFIVLLVLGALAAVLYLTLGGGLSVFVGDSPKLVEFTETGSNIVEGEFKITNQKFWSGLEDPQSEEFISMAQSIEGELDTLFSNSVWSREYNRSEVVSLAPGSLLVQARLILNRADAAAAQKLGTAFLRGLHNRRGHEWLGTFTIDITSIRFTEVMLETPAPPTIPFSSASVESSSPAPVYSSSVGNVVETTTQSQETSRAPQRPHHLNVGWGEWGPWSTCSPCSPQYDQIRTRQCRLEGGSGLLINSIEACLHTEMTQGTNGDMEIRPCQCDFTTSTTTARTTTTTMSAARIPLKDGEAQDEAGDESDTDVGTSVTGKQERLCDECTASEVCVAMQDEPYPTCRSPIDAADPTGCGGLCAIDSEVCQALGSRAFRCHSASQCLEDEWRCEDGLCIPLIKRCDGHMNCYDQSDENKCDCGTEAFQCGNNTSCLPLTAKCDGQMDCWDGSDEVNCTNLVNASHSSSSVTASKTALTAQTNPSDVLDIAKPTSSDAEMDGASGVVPSAMAGTRAGTTLMNRTAIGLSILSHRERELLA